MTFVGVYLLLRRVRRDGNVGVDGLECLLRHLQGFVQTLVLIEIGIVRFFGEFARYRNQQFRIVTIESESFASHFHDLVGVPGALVQTHG